MLLISELFVYPIKSLGGISVSSAMVTDRGFENDRRWMLVDEQNGFLTLRQFPKMVFLKVFIEKSCLRIKSFEYPIEDLLIPFDAEEDDCVSVTIWNATVAAKKVGQHYDKWFSEVLGKPCRLVYMPDVSMRPVDTTSGFHPEGKFTSFADAYPFMMIGQASLDDLNHRVQVPISMERFRPNIVFTGGYPNQEDTIENFFINNIPFTGIEKCARCKIPNIDICTGTLNKYREPLRTLATYRLENKKIWFGRNVVHSGTGIVKVGDELLIG